jgi:hypothetical protein
MPQEGVVVVVRTPQAEMLLVDSLVSVVGFVFSIYDK